MCIEQCSTTSSVWETTKIWRNSRSMISRSSPSSSPAALGVLAGEDLVQDDEPGLDATLMGERARERQAQAKRGKVLLAAGKPPERMQPTAVGDLELVGVGQLDAP